MSIITNVNFEAKYDSPEPGDVAQSPLLRSYSLRPRRSVPPPPSKSETDASLRRFQSAFAPMTRSRSRNLSSYQFEQQIDKSSPWFRRPRAARSASATPPSTPIPSPSSSPSPSLSPLPHILEEKSAQQSNNAHISSSSSAFPSTSASDPLSECISSPRFYPLPSLWKQIPSRARLPFTNNLRSLLSEYTSAHTLGNRGECDKLIHQLLNFPRIFLPIRSHRGQRRIDSAEHLKQRLQHHKYQNEVVMPNNRSAEQQRKRLVDQDANAVKRAVSLVKMGDNKRAIQTLSSHTPIAPINDDTVNKLRELHPKQSDPLPHSPPSTAPRIIVNRTELGRIIRRKLNNGASGGPSGWTGKHLQPLVTDKECMEGLSAIIQDICNGDITDQSLRKKLLACRLVPLSKPNGGIRPVAIGEVFCKLASCYLISLSMKSESYRTLFPTIQEGVGIAGGCENVIHFVRAARRAMGDDAIVITVDFKNAYNMRKRIDMWECLLKHCGGNSGADLSPLLRYFHWAYSISSPLVLPAVTDDRSSNHLVTMHSCEGVRQGANESSLLFSLSMQEIYEKSLEGLDVKKVQAKAIQDDFTIVGKPADALKAFQRLVELSEKHGMKVQPNKCCILPPSTPSESASTVIEQLSEFGVRQTPLLHLLGATLGQDEDIDRDSALVKEWAEGVSTAENERFFKLLTHRDMPVQIAFRLLVSSGLPRLAYLCRVMPPSSLSVATHEFDKLIMKTLYKLCDIKMNTRYDNMNDLGSITRQAQLKMKNGGLGITPYSQIAPAAFISSLANATPAILSLFAEIGETNDAIKLTKEKYDRLYERIRQQLRQFADDANIVDLLPPSKESFDKEYTKHTPRTNRRATHPSPALYESVESVAHLQSKLSAAIEKKRADQYESSLDKFSRARLLSASQPSASIWLTTLPEEDSLRLSNNEFIAAIRHRFALSSQRHPKCCECNPLAGPVNDSQHPHVCRLLRKEETFRRHQMIRDTLFELCRFAGFTATHTFPLRYPISHYRDSNDDDIDDAEILPDLYVFTSNETYMIDVSITFPPASSFIGRLHTDTRPLAAAKMREYEKVRKYDSLARHNGMVFVPFVLESFGAVGKQAKKFISIIAEQMEESNQFYAYALRRLSIALQKGNAIMQTQGMRRLFVSANYVNSDRRQQAPDLLCSPSRPSNSFSLDAFFRSISNLDRIDILRPSISLAPPPTAINSRLATPVPLSSPVLEEKSTDNNNNDSNNNNNNNDNIAIVAEEKENTNADNHPEEEKMDANNPNDVELDAEVESINSDVKNNNSDNVAVSENNNNIDNNIIVDPLSMSFSPPLRDDYRIPAPVSLPPPPSAFSVVNVNAINRINTFERIRRFGDPMPAIVVRAVVPPTLVDGLNTRRAGQ